VIAAHKKKMTVKLKILAYRGLGAVKGDVCIVFKNVLSLDTPAYDMMQGTRRIYSGLTWYVTSLPQTNEKRNA